MDRFVVKRKRSDVDVGTSRQPVSAMGQDNVSSSAGLPREINLDELPYDPADQKIIIWLEPEKKT